MITISLFYYCKKVFILLNIWMIEKEINETSCTEKEYFYSHLNKEDITDADYAHVKRVCKESAIKNSGKYHDFYVQIVKSSILACK